MRGRAYSSRLWIGVALVVALLCVAVSLPAAKGQESPDKAAQFAAAMQDGNQKLAQRQFLAAISAFKKANEIKDKKSPEALFSMSRVYFAMSAFSDAVDRCTDALKFTGDDARAGAQVYYMRGMSLVALALQKDTDGEFKGAEEDFRAAMKLTDKTPAAYQLGALLMRQGKDADGAKVLEDFVATSGNSPDAEEARRMIENPRRARESYSPEFSFTSLQGQHIELKDLRGKAVLLDFWGTWCPPCRASTPSLVKFFKKHEKDPFVMIGVAVNDKQDDWKAYIKEHNMDWPQYFDAARKMARVFNVTAFPTYIILDGDGIIKSRQLGWGNGAEGLLDSEIKNAIKASRAPSAMEPLFARPQTVVR